MIPNRLTRGNKKLSKDIAIFNLPAVRTCLNCNLCKDTCYARKAEKIYPNVLPFRTLNLELSKKYPNELKDSIIHQIKKQSIKVVRIHESGDFYSKKYISLWCEIIKTLPNVKFYAYTKVKDILDFTPLTNLKNFNLVNSLLPDGSLNFDVKEVIIDKAKKYNCKVCPCEKGKTVVCGKDCTICQDHQNVVFIKH